MARYTPFIWLLLPVCFNLVFIAITISNCRSILGILVRLSPCTILLFIHRKWDRNSVLHKRQNCVAIQFNACFYRFAHHIVCILNGVLCFRYNFRSCMKLYLQNDVLVVHGIYALADTYTRNHLGTCIVYLIVHVYCWIGSDWVGMRYECIISASIFRRKLRLRLKWRPFLPNEWIKMIFVLFDSKGNVTVTMTKTTIMNEQNNISSVFATRSAGLLNFLLKLNIKAIATW